MSPSNHIDKPLESKRKDVDLEKLLDLIVQRKEPAMREFYGRTSNLVYSLANRILRDEQDTEEVTLDVYMYVWNKAQNYDPKRAAPTTWLMMLARTGAIGKLRSKRKHLNIQTMEEQKLESGIDNPEQSVEFKQNRELIKNALDQLTDEQRRAIELTYFYGLTHVEIADLLDAPLGTVKGWIRLGMRKMREFV